MTHPQSKSPKRDLFLFPGDERLNVEDSGSSLYDDAIEPAAYDGEEEEEGESDDEFCILEHPEKEPEGLTDQVLIRCLAQEQLRLVDNHFAVPVRTQSSQDPLGEIFVRPPNSRPVQRRVILDHQLSSVLIHVTYRNLV